MQSASYYCFLKYRNYGSYLKSEREIPALKQSQNPIFSRFKDYRFKMCSYADNHGTLGISDLPGMRKKTFNFFTRHTAPKWYFGSNFLKSLNNFYRSVVHELVQSPPFKEPRKYVRTHQKKAKGDFPDFPAAGLKNSGIFFPFHETPC